MELSKEELNVIKVGIAKLDCNDCLFWSECIANNVRYCVNIARWTEEMTIVKEAWWN